MRKALSSASSLHSWQISLGHKSPVLFGCACIWGGLNGPPSCSIKSRLWAESLDGTLAMPEASSCVWSCPEKLSMKLGVRLRGCDVGIMGVCPLEKFQIPCFGPQDPSCGLSSPPPAPSHTTLPALCSSRTSRLLLQTGLLLPELSSFLLQPTLIFHIQLRYPFLRQVF